ncbi:NAD-dependent succinate-semialdehyde dehydrogenase [Roseovarius indicus]|uniref:Aldehyde dehydrogenase n=1 Tax=Roseovarius indicus TaxID=540747 RepID=A0A0T5P336_9RHOB|nr:NAD-dependent succinate-semialdehyde dehydrogenase [Roseovarius indicus]KRS15548.1 aldehyde dehydrogenase [Roseovarius indicus]QEW25253.1 Alpha-ketoglutaric semialdehyde dehydrogenase [Roseovarius indicus]SFE19422.1 succinate semialdehyde dehydrogenase [Roseovarius indicus]
MSTYPELKLFIGGEWRKTPEDLPVLNPATEEELGRLPHARVSDLEDALGAAQDGFEIWRKTPPRTRSDIILKAAAIMRARQEEIAQSITAEHGKPLKQARLEVIRGAEFFEWDAAEAMRVYGRVIPSAPGTKIAVHHHPIGVVAAFSPWNFPMSQPARKIAGALASGCAIILKAAEETPAGAIHIVRAFEEAGLPKGVLNLVFGTPSEISEYLIPQPSVRLVALTGSTIVGRQLTALAAQSDTPVLMELGGHAPVIVCEDTDVKRAALSGAVRKMRNAGQVCTSPTRFFVHESIYDSFADTFTERAAATVVGNGIDDGVEMGPTANDRRVPVLTDLVEDAVAKGAELRTGGARRGNKGYFFEPTVLANVPDTAQIMQTEPFGPIAVLNPVRDLDEAIAKANSVPYGLAGYAFTNRADYIDRMIDGVEVGNFSINTLEASLPETPFGGVKSSGYGREGGTEGLESYLTKRNVWYSSEIA